MELILAERGVIVTRESTRQWCLKFGADLARRLHRRRSKPGDVWHLDKVLSRISGDLHHLCAPWIRVARFKLSGQTQRFLSLHAMIYGHFRPLRHPMTTAQYRRTHAKAFPTW